jgi:glucose dehydrogenase
MEAVRVRVAAFVAVCVLVVVVVAGCGGGSSSSSSSPTTTTPSSETGGGGTGGSQPASFESEEPSTSWPSVGDDIGGTRYSTASQVTPENIAELKPAYLAMLEPPGSQGSGSENNPIESEGVIYASSSSETPVLGAYDAATGKEIWQTSAADIGIKNVPPNIGTRGMAIGDGLVYVEEPGGVLAAFDQKTGKPAWKALVNAQRVYQYSQPTPVYWDGLVYSASPAATSSAGCAGS